jgi:acetyl-CoA carboxylase biotin carboxyl carrier protein
MAGSSSQQDVFDLRKLRRLVELMKEHELSELQLQQGETRIQMRRGGEEVSVVPRPAAPQATPAAPAAPAAPVEAPADEAHIAMVKSPMVGTFYSSPDPESPPYVKVGDHVGAETTVCIIEAMKVFNQIPAEVSGKIVATLVENGDPIEFGQPLFKVDTRG